jgi:hypothetical protein
MKFFNLKNAASWVALLGSALLITQCTGKSHHRKNPETPETNTRPDLSEPLPEPHGVMDDVKESQDLSDEDKQAIEAWSQKLVATCSAVDIMPSVASNPKNKAAKDKPRPRYIFSYNVSKKLDGNESVTTKDGFVRLTMAEEKVASRQSETLEAIGPNGPYEVSTQISDGNCVFLIRTPNTAYYLSYPISDKISVTASFHQNRTRTLPIADVYATPIPSSAMMGWKLSEFKTSGRKLLNDLWIELLKPRPEEHIAGLSAALDIPEEDLKTFVAASSRPEYQRYELLEAKDSAFPRLAVDDFLPVPQIGLKSPVAFYIERMHAGILGWRILQGQMTVNFPNGCTGTQCQAEVSYEGSAMREEPDSMIQNQAAALDCIREQTTKWVDVLREYITAPASYRLLVKPCGIFAKDLPSVLAGEPDLVGMRMILNHVLSDSYKLNAMGSETVGDWQRPLASFLGALLNKSAGTYLKLNLAGSAGTRLSSYIKLLEDAFTNQKIDESHRPFFHEVVSQISLAKDDYATQEGFSSQTCQVVGGNGILKTLFPLSLKFRNLDAAFAAIGKGLTLDYSFNSAGIRQDFTCLSRDIYGKANAIVQKPDLLAAMQDYQKNLKDLVHLSPSARSNATTVIGANLYSQALPDQAFIVTESQRFADLAQFTQNNLAVLPSDRPGMVASFLTQMQGQILEEKWQNSDYALAQDIAHMTATTQQDLLRSSEICKAEQLMAQWFCERKDYLSLDLVKSSVFSKENYMKPGFKDILEAFRVFQQKFKSSPDQKAIRLKNQFIIGNWRLCSDMELAEKATYMKKEASEDNNILAYSSALSECL